MVACARVSLTAHLKLDSREIEPGDVFVACPGLSSDGRLYIEKALALGASAILFEAPASEAVEAAAAQAPMLPVTGLRALLGELGDTWYGRPSAARRGGRDGHQRQNVVRAMDRPRAEPQ